MSLQDKHLQQALKSAPDRDMVPNEATRAVVLNYANNAVKRRDKAWLNPISNFLREWLGVSWHMAGVGSAVATVLVVVVFWHELPDDTMRKAATPSEEAQISATDLAEGGAPEAASAEKTLDEATSGTMVPAQESSAAMVENKAVIDETLGKAKSASSVASASRETLNSADKPALKNRGLAEAAPQAAAPAAIESEIPVVAASAPAPMIQDKAVIASAPVANASTNDVAGTISKGELVKEHQTESDASFKMRREDVVAKKSAAKSDSLGASAPKIASKPQESQTLLARIKSEGGNAVANQDIQVGNLRLLKVEIQTKDSNTLNCPQLTGQVLAIDALTGYKIESVASCGISTSLQKEVEVYNQTVHDWYTNHAK